jgi:hypothetical protein
VVGVGGPMGARMGALDEKKASSLVSIAICKKSHTERLSVYASMVVEVAQILAIQLNSNPRCDPGCRAAASRRFSLHIGLGMASYSNLQ